MGILSDLGENYGSTKIRLRVFEVNLVIRAGRERHVSQLAASIELELVSELVDQSEGSVRHQTQSHDLARSDVFRHVPDAVIRHARASAEIRAALEAGRAAILCVFGPAPFVDHTG